MAGIDDAMADIKLLVKTALSQTADSYFLIIDNPDDVDLLSSTTGGATPLSDYLPFSQRGSILFTTRNHEVVRKLDIPGTGIIRVVDMSRLEATDGRKHFR
jgi:hypothetical protein